MEKKFKKGQRKDDYSKTVVEGCSYCQGENELKNDFTVQKCKNCGWFIVPCNQCEAQRQGKCNFDFDYEKNGCGLSKKAYEMNVALAIETLEYYQNGYARLSGCSVKAENIAINKKDNTVTADVTFNDNGETEYYPEVPYQLSRLKVTELEPKLWNKEERGCGV